MNISIEGLWSLEVGVGPAEHGVYKFRYLWLSPTFRSQFWKVNPETGLLWVCKPTVERNLETYDLNGRLIHRLTLPSPPTTYACPQIWKTLWLSYVVET